MRGWRCKIGIIIPIDNTIIEPELYELSSAGVTVHGSRLHTMTLDEMPDDAEREAESLGKMGADVIAYACNASSFYGGSGSDEAISERIAAAAGVPATTASTAMVRALDTLDTQTVSVISPYQDEDRRRLKRFLTGYGFDVSNMTGLGLAADEEEALAEMNDETAEETYRRVLENYDAAADTVLVTSTNIESVRLLDQLETDLERPVVSTNQALYWDALRLVGRQPTVEGYGRLLERE